MFFEMTYQVRVTDITEDAVLNDSIKSLKQLNEWLYEKKGIEI